MDMFDWLFNNFGKLWIAWAVISTAIGLGVLGVIVWAIITVVNAVAH